MKFCTIQFLRFIAAFLVLLFHLQLMDSGYKGVDIFFVISGYVMYLKLSSPSRPAAFTFFTNRFTKIFFLYWIALCLLYIFKPFPINNSIWPAIFLLPGHESIINISWTLSYELYFYFLIGAIAFLLPGRYFNAICFLFLLLSSIFTFSFLSGIFYLKGTIFLLGKFTWLFFLGVAAGFLSANFYKLFKAELLLAMSLAAFALEFIVRVPSGTATLSACIYGVITLPLIFLITSYERRVLINKKIIILFTMLGDASYAIYLLGRLISMIISANNIVSKSFIIVIIIIISILVNRLIENSGLKWCRKMIYRLVPARFR
jgi:exopolysaccharide production protein ExoZ